MSWRSEPFCFVTSRGRVTGRDHTIEIWFAARGRTLYVLAGDGRRSDTVRNLRVDARARIRVGTTTWTTTARVLEDDDAEAAVARELIPAKYADEEEGLDEWAQQATAVAFDLPPDAVEEG